MSLGTYGNATHGQSLYGGSKTVVASVSRVSELTSVAGDDSTVGSETGTVTTTSSTTAGSGIGTGSERASADIPVASSVKSGVTSAIEVVSARIPLSLNVDGFVKVTTPVGSITFSRSVAGTDSAVGAGVAELAAGNLSVDGLVESTAGKGLIETDVPVRFLVLERADAKQAEAAMMTWAGSVQSDEVARAGEQTATEFETSFGVSEVVTQNETGNILTFTAVDGANETAAEDEQLNLDQPVHTRTFSSGVGYAKAGQQINVTPDLIGVATALAPTLRLPVKVALYVIATSSVSESTLTIGAPISVYLEDSSIASSIVSSRHTTTISGLSETTNASEAVSAIASAGMRIADIAEVAGETDQVTAPVAFDFTDSTLILSATVNVRGGAEKTKYGRTGSLRYRTGSDVQYDNSGELRYEQQGEPVYED